MVVPAAPVVALVVGLVVAVGPAVVVVRVGPVVVRVGPVVLVVRVGPAVLVVRVGPAVVVVPVGPVVARLPARDPAVRRAAAPGPGPVAVRQLGATGPDRAGPALQPCARPGPHRPTGAGRGSRRRREPRGWTSMIRMVSGCRRCSPRPAWVPVGSART
jgi:hypothetical protein